MLLQTAADGRRVAVGLEHVEDLRADLQRGLAALG